MTYLKRATMHALLFLSPLIPHVGLAQDSQKDAHPRETATLQATEPKATDESFVAGSGGDLDQYLFRANVAGGRLSFNIPITRYYGVANTPADIQDLINKKLLPEKAKLTLRIYDVDHNSTYDGNDDGIPDPERDYVYVNNRLVTDATGNGIFLQSGNDTWSIMSFDIPTTWLLFPTQQGTDNTKPLPRNNEIAIDIDVTTPGYWAIECDWGSIFIKSPIRPVLLVHGWNGDPSTWNTFKGFFEGDKIPFRIPAAGILDPLGAIANNALSIGAEIVRLKNRFGVDKVNLMVHSKGGVDSRRAIENRKDVENLIQLGTPNHGSELADALYDPLSLIPIQRAAGTSQMRTSWIRDNFNYIPKHHGWFIYSYFPRYVVNPLVNYRILAGNNGGIRIVIPRPHDGVVSTRSATYPWRILDYTRDIPYPKVANVDLIKPYDHSLHQHRDVYEWGINQIKPGFFPEIPPARQVEMMSASLISSEQINLPIDSTQMIKKISHDIATSQTITDSILVFEADTVGFIVATTDANLEAVLVDPSGSVIDSAIAASRPDIEYQNESNEWGQFIVYQVTVPVAGTWTVRTTALAGGNYSTTASVVGSTFLLNGTDKYSYAADEPIQVGAEFKRDLTPLLNSTVSATITLSDASSSTITLFDDGLHQDLSANDGFYSNSFPGFSTTGFADIIVNAQNDSIIRQSSLNVLVSPASAQLTGSYSETPIDSDGDGLYNALDITVEINVVETGHYSLSGTLTDNSGNRIQSQTYSTLIDGLPELSPGVHNINFSFDGQIDLTPIK